MISFDKINFMNPFLEVVDLEAEMIDALSLIVALDFDERDVDVAVGHIDRPAESMLRLQAEHFLIELHHFIAILRHHRDMPNFWSHFFSASFFYLQPVIILCFDPYAISYN